MIMVDELVIYQQAPQPGAARYFGSGKASCHLTTDGPESELDAFAVQLGLNLRWGQKRGTPEFHFDLTPNKRAQALRLGAQFVSGMDQARRRIAARAPHDEETAHA